MIDIPDDMPASKSGLFLLSIADEIETQVGFARESHPDRAPELERLTKSAQMIRDHGHAIMDQTINAIPSETLLETLLEIRDLLTSTMDLAKAFGQDGQRLQ